MADNSVTMTIRGSKEVQRALKKAGKRGREVLRDALNAGGDVILQEARINAPVRKNTGGKMLPGSPGWLRDHLAKKTAFDDASGVVVLVGGNERGFGRGGNMALWQEFGTSKQPARPFLRPAFETKKHAAINVIKIRLKKDLKL